ncbi:hypothetical protein D4764_05G0010870 [Takifugu flavidus]|uniref:Reverse transcriptase domain-containing protein n=1 Tax=Takifugu flavidus TaxID=433684 RepID=A0A5C6N5Q9_9TELE|nr:hypothetical protein D4764_05G0010870 [Takifugu flavidus]
MENDFQTTSKRFWTTIQCLRKGKQCTVNTVYSGNGVLLISTRDVVDRWKEYFENLLNPTNAPSIAEVVKKLRGGKAPGVDEIRLEFLKALDVVGLSWLTRLCNITCTSGALDWQTRVVVPLFKKGGQRVCSNYSGITLLSLPRVLREYGVPGPLIRAVRSLYDWCQSLVRIAGRSGLCSLQMMWSCCRHWPATSTKCEAAGMRISTSKSKAECLLRVKEEIL